MNETLLLQKEQAFLALQPVGVLIGAELHALSPGRCELQLPVTEKTASAEWVCAWRERLRRRPRADLCRRTLLEWAVVISEFKINYVSEQKLCAVGQGTIARFPVKASPT